MEAKTDKNTPSSKKFSFRKRKTSKGKKEFEETPVDCEFEEAAELIARSSDESPQQKVDEIVSQGTVQETQSSGEDPSPKNDNTTSSANKSKKSKRRGLFKRSDKKSTVESCEGVSDEIDETGAGIDTKESSLVVYDSKTSAVQIASEGQHGDITDASDNEGYLTGEASEPEGELSETEALTPENKNSSSEQGKGGKRKRFFKRGLSLKRKKNKKQTNEVKDECTQGKDSKVVKPDTIDLVISTHNQPAQESKNTALFEEFENGEATTKDKRTKSEQEASLSINKDSVKPSRKVSFIGPDGEKLASSDESNLAETGDESDDDTVTAEDDLDAILKVDAPGIVVMLEDAGCSEAITEAEDDDLTEVSSMSSSLLVSSDAQETPSISDALRLASCADIEDTGSRITLEGISEESETELKPEVVDGGSEIASQSKVGVTVKEGSEDKSEGNGFESRPKVGNEEAGEVITLLGDSGANKGSDEWEMISKSYEKSYEMSMELSRVRKQTLFNVKRLCCCVM